MSSDFLKLTNEYIRSFFSEEDDRFFKEMREYAKTHKTTILLGESVQFLKSIVSIARPKKILEIGTAIGYSGSIMLKHSVDARLVTIEIDESIADIAAENFYRQGLSDKVTLIRGDAGEVLKYMDAQFDFVFMDGPKSKYVDYLPYINKLLVKGGILLCDNVLFRGMIASEEKANDGKKTIIRKLKLFLESICDNSVYSTSIFPLGDGLSLSIKK